MRRIDELARNAAAGASALLADAVAVLQDALATGEEILPVARAVCRAQPSMASVWNAALAACAPDGAARLERFARRAERAPGAIARFARECFLASPRAPLRIVTLSCSGSVLHALGALGDRSGASPALSRGAESLSPSIHVSCSESRPALEGRRLAESLVTLGAGVAYYSDASIGQALADADAVIVGADAIAPQWFVNKSGTRMLAASAAQQGIPVYVVASRDKFVPVAVAERLEIREEAPSEIWRTAPEGLTVRNRYFESTPLELVTHVISDAGVLAADMVPDVCASTSDDITLRLIEQLA